MISSLPSRIRHVCSLLLRPSPICPLGKKVTGLLLLASGLKTNVKCRPDVRIFCNRLDCINHLRGPKDHTKKAMIPVDTSVIIMPTMISLVIVLGSITSNTLFILLQKPNIIISTTICHQFSMLAGNCQERSSVQRVAYSGQKSTSKKLRGLSGLSGEPLFACPP